MATGRLLALRPESRGRARRALSPELSLGTQGADAHTVAGYHPIDTDHSVTEHTGHRPVAVHHHHSAPSVMGAHARAAGEGARDLV